MKFMKHIGLLLIGGLLIALGISVDLNSYPVFQYLDYFVWPMLILVLILGIFKLRKTACFIMGVLCFCGSLSAATHTAEICTYYQTYSQKIAKYQAEYFKQDEPCDESIWQKARQEAADYKDLPGSCASDLMSICSEYERRHPEKVVRTVATMMNEAVGKAGRVSTACWPCDMAYVVFTVIQSLSASLSDVMAETAFKMLLICTAFWLLWKAAGMVLTSKGGTFFKQIMATLLGIMMVSLILKNNGQYLTVLYSQFLTPVMKIGLYVSDKIQTSVGLESSFFRSATSGQPFYKQVETQASSSLGAGVLKTSFMDYCGSSTTSGSSSNPFAALLGRATANVFPSISTNFPGLVTTSSDKTLLNDDLKGQFLCLTQKFYYQSRPFIVIGQTLITFASRKTETILGMDTRFPKNMEMWFMGVLLVGLFGYFSFLVAFRIMDIFLRLGFVMVLMPLFVAAIVFPTTREFTKKGWTFLFQIIVEFIGLSISISFVMLMLESVVAPHSSKLLEALSARYSSDYGENLFEAVTSDMTWLFPFMLIAIVIMGEKILKAFPVIIASLFEVSDTSDKGKAGSMMAGAIGGMVAGTVGVYNSAKGAAQTSAKNPYKTKETKAKDAKKDLEQKKKKLEEEKKKLAQAKLKEGQMRGTGKEGMARKEVGERQKDVDKAQKDVDEAQKKYDLLQKDADKETSKTAPSQSSYSARRFSKDAGNSIRRGGGKAAEAVDKFGSKVGGFLMKNGIGRLAGVPLVLGTKALSTGIRAASKTAELGVKGVGLAGAGIQAVAGKKSTPKAPKPPPKA